MFVLPIATLGASALVIKYWLDSVRENRRNDAAAKPQPVQLFKLQGQFRDDPGMRGVNAYAMRNKNQLLRRRRPAESVKF